MSIVVDDDAKNTTPLINDSDDEKKN